MNISVRRIVRCATIAGVYVALCLILHPFSYGTIQVRISEALTILPIFTPDAILGLTVGCFLSNMLSYNILDMVFGTLATLLSAICTFKLAKYRLKGLPVLACLPPIIFNAIIVGLEITYLFMPEPASFAVLLFNIFSVGVGQVVSCMLIGLPLAKLIEKNKPLSQFFTE